HTNRERAFLGVTDRDHTLRGANGELTIDGSRPLVAAEAVSLHFLGQYAGRRRQVERGLEAAAIRTGLRLVQRAEGRAAEGRGGVIAPLWERRFSPEVEPVDVAMREVHRTLMWLVAVFTGDLRGDRISTRHDGAVRASQRKEIWFRDRCVEVIRRERTAADPHVDRGSVARQRNRLCV